MGLTHAAPAGRGERLELDDVPVQFGELPGDPGDGRRGAALRLHSQPQREPAGGDVHEQPAGPGDPAHGRRACAGDAHRRDPAGIRADAQRSRDGAAAQAQHDAQPGAGSQADDHDPRPRRADTRLHGAHLGGAGTSGLPGRSGCRSRRAANGGAATRGSAAAR